MASGEVLEYIQRSERRRTVVALLSRPMTANQLSRNIGLTQRQCSITLRELQSLGVTNCLNESAVKSRIYWLTKSGQLYQKSLRQELKLPTLAHDFPDVDWTLYGKICFSHRAAVLKAVSNEPMQPSQIRRRACYQNPSLRMSANNCRDVMKLFLKWGLVEKVPGRRKKSHPRYVLTDRGGSINSLSLFQVNDTFISA